MIPKPRVNLDWRSLHAVVLESDDWGLCAWSPDEQAHRVLDVTPAFRSAVGLLYGRSTLESAADVRSLGELLLACRGADGIAPVWQANTVMAAPDYPRLEKPGHTEEPLPLVFLPETPSRWRREGMWEEVASAIEAGVWWPELHGLHHLPAHAWLEALRRREEDACLAWKEQSPICRAVEGSGEYDPAEPEALRREDVATAVEWFTKLFGRAPSSFCPPDYRWDEGLERDAERLGVTTFQGRAERMRSPLPRLRRLLHRYRWPHRNGRRFYLPPRIAFEPRGDARVTRFGVEPTRTAVRAAWRRGQPAIVSSHRLNYAHLDADWSAAGREALRALIEGLAGEGAVFVTDAEVRQLVERGWSMRPLGSSGALMRVTSAAAAPIRFPAPRGVVGAMMVGAGAAPGGVALEGGEVLAPDTPGVHRIVWSGR